ncbi:MAG: ribonuclease P protein component [Candidatus Daviesbacteria bacterium]|nr:ribonuclease P protein component [Candidatus Daviesbacteria bacterium]
MLPKLQRLNLKKDFKWVAAGKKLETKYAKLFMKPGDNQTPKIGIAVSSKTFAKATQRNRARRLVSSAIESLYPSLPNNINIIALPKAGAIEVKSGDLSLDLEEGLKKEKIL